jgi:hypothetical protein
LQFFFFRFQHPQSRAHHVTGQVLAARFHGFRYKFVKVIAQDTRGVARHGRFPSPTEYQFLILTPICRGLCLARAPAITRPGLDPGPLGLTRGPGSEAGAPLTPPHPLCL